MFQIMYLKKKKKRLPNPIVICNHFLAVQVCVNIYKIIVIFCIRETLEITKGTLKFFFPHNKMFSVSRNGLESISTADVLGASECGSVSALLCTGLALL